MEPIAASRRQPVQRSRTAFDRGGELAAVVELRRRFPGIRDETWDETQLERPVWIIPARRMKAAREHRVPLSNPALAVLRAMAPMRAERGSVFPGLKPQPSGTYV